MVRVVTHWERVMIGKSGGEDKMEMGRKRMRTTTARKFNENETGTARNCPFRCTGAEWELFLTPIVVLKILHYTEAME